MSNKYRIKIINNENIDKDDFYCNLCKWPLVSSNDFRKNSEYGCCNECYLTFVEARKDKWCDGWRPKRNVLDSYIKERKRLYSIV